MKSRYLFAAAASLVLTLSSLTPSAAVSFPDRAVSSNTEAPWAAQLEMVISGKRFSCTGVLIDPMHVLTAAHCLYPASELTKVLVTFPYSTDSRVLTALATKHHPRYSPRLSWINDIAVVRLKNPVTAFKPIKITQKSDTALLKKGMRIYGYGYDQNLDDNGALNTLSVSNRTTELKTFRGFNSATMIGVGRYFPKERIWGGACDGDSGGPLVGYSGKTQVLVGIASYGFVDGAYCDSQYPSVYTRVSVYLDWIKTTTSDLNRIYDRPGVPAAPLLTPQPGGFAVNWAEPVSVGRDPVSYYKLIIYTDNEATPLVSKFTGTGTIVNGLEAGHTYRFSVMACSSRVCSEPSPEFVLTL